jgi:hypothetical protein
MSPFLFGFGKVEKNINGYQWLSMARNIDSFRCLKMWLSMAVTINGLILMGHFGGNHGELTSKYKGMH